MLEANPNPNPGGDPRRTKQNYFAKFRKSPQPNVDEDNSDDADNDIENTTNTHEGPNPKVTKSSVT